MASSKKRGPRRAARGNGAKPVSGAKPRRAPKADWTWLIYMAGDNDLESAGLADLRELKRVGSSDRVHVVVQYDTEERGTTRYRVGKGSLAVLESMKGVNTGSPKTLRDFVKWGLRKFPAQRVLLDVWNHGGGWENLPADYDYGALRAAAPRRAARVRRLRRALFKTTIATVMTRAPHRRAIAIDTGSQDYLDNQELRGAIRDALGARRKVDLLGLDACLMNMLEIAYELRDVAGVLVGSEETEPAAGWPYGPILARLVKRPGMSARELAPIIVEEYGRYFRRAREIATQSALDLARVEDLRAPVDALARALLPRVKAGDDAVIGRLLRARSAALHFEDSPEYVDLADLCRQLVARMADQPAAVRAARAVLAALAVDPAKGFVLANTTASRSMAGAGGVSIYFPATRDENAPDYAKLQFSRRGRWNELLEALGRS